MYECIIIVKYSFGEVVLLSNAFPSVRPSQAVQRGGEGPSPLPPLGHFDKDFTKMLTPLSVSPSSFEFLCTPLATVHSFLAPVCYQMVRFDLIAISPLLRLLKQNSFLNKKLLEGKS